MANVPLDSKVCLVPDCDRQDGERMRRGYCSMHYQRFKAHGDPSIVYSNKRPDLYCVVDGCQSKARTDEYCGKHYARYLRYGDATVVHKPGLPRRLGKCVNDDCNRDAVSKNLCMRHYNQKRRHQDPQSAYMQTRRRMIKKRTLQPVPFTKQQLAARLSMFANKCWMCGKSADTVDHVKPIKLGGLDCLSNLRPACRSCNASKKARWFGVRNLALFIKT